MVTIEQYCRKELEVTVNDKLNSSPQCHPVAKKLTFLGCMNRNVTCRTCEEILLPPLQTGLAPVLHTVFPEASGSAGGDSEESKRNI